MSADAGNGLPTPPVPRARRHGRNVSIGLAASLVLHLLAAAYLLWGKQPPRRGGHVAPRHAVMIALTLDSFTTPPAPPTPPKPRQDQAAEKVPRPAPVPPHKAAAPQKSAAPSSRSMQARNQADKPEDTDEVLGQIHDNWLEPPGIGHSFHCRVQIDYAVGGTILQVRLLEGCGSQVLDDSVKRAVWKTQPLPVASAKQQAGRLEIEFSP